MVVAREGSRRGVGMVREILGTRMGRLIFDFLLACFANCF